jgi:hypothetical protein
MSTKQIVAPTLLILVLAGVAFLLRGKGRLPATPEEAVNLLFQAEQQGDAAAYLAILSGGLRTSSESTQAELGAKAFANGLREAVAGMKGLAISSAGESSADRVELDVELVFPDRNERQRFILVREGGGWRIAQIDNANTVKPPIPYGAPVFDSSGTKGGV